MDLAQLYDELAHAAAKVGVEVREELFEAGLREARVPRGGLCTVHGRRVILVDSGEPLPDRIAMLAAALAEVDLDAVYVAPAVRATIALYRRGPKDSAAEPVAQPLARTNPRPENDVD
jgi:hypothetical protein